MENINKVYGVIYKAENTQNGMIYIGATTRGLNHRKRQHILNSKSKDFKKTRITNALQECGENNFSWSVIDNAFNQEELNNKELYWIKFYESWGEKGYNIMSINILIKGKSISATTSTDVAKQIIDDLKSGLMTVKDIAIKHNVKKDLIYRIRQGKTWTHLLQEGDLEEMISLKTTKQNKYQKIKEDLLKNLYTRKEIGVKYNITDIEISAITRGVSPHVDVTEDEILEMNGGQLPSSRLTEEKVKEIVEVIKENKLSVAEIAEKMNVKISRVYGIKAGNSYRRYVTEEDVEGMQWRPPLRLNEISEIENKLFNNIPVESIAEEYSISIEDIYKIEKGDYL